MIERLISNVTSEHLVLKAKTEILSAGEIAKHVYIVRSGCARLWFNHNGDDITLQFFLPGQIVASFDSLLHNTPSQFTLETIMPTEVEAFKKKDIEKLLAEHPESTHQLTTQAFELASKYVNLFLSRIKDSPQKRYEHLLKEHPEIVALIPQHYIASYLGITPVSLSRIRSRMLKKK